MGALAMLRWPPPLLTSASNLSREKRFIFLKQTKKIVPVTTPTAIRMISNAIKTETRITTTEEVKLAGWISSSELRHTVPVVVLDG